MKPKLHHLNLSTKNVELMKEFYKEILFLEKEKNDLPKLEKGKFYSGEVDFLTDGTVQTHIAEIDNATIEIDNEEVPIMDGSAFEFLTLLQRTKLSKLPEKRKYLKINNRVELNAGERKIFIEPNEFSLKIDFKLIDGAG